MKNAKTKIISTIMSLMMLAGLSQGAFAAPLIEVPSEDEIFLQFNGHGQYTEVANAFSANIASNLETQEAGNVIIATTTDDQDLYFLSGNDYLLKVASGNAQENAFLHVERADIDVKNFSSETLDEFNLPPELVERITAIIETQTAMGNDDFEASVYSPLSTSNADDGALQPYSLQNEAVTMGSKESWEEYYTLYGQEFTDSYLKFKNYQCVYSNASTNASTAASALVSFILDCVGTQSTTVSAFQFGYSALETLAAFLGVSVAQAGTGYQAIQTIVTYDAIYRLTYWNIGNDPYVATCKAWLNTNATQQTQDDIPAGVYQTSTFLNTEKFSPHYSNPAEWLYTDYYNAAFIIEGPIYHTILDQKYMLV